MFNGGKTAKEESANLAAHIYYDSWVRQLSGQRLHVKEVWLDKGKDVWCVGIASAAGACIVVLEARRVDGELDEEFELKVMALA